MQLNYVVNGLRVPTRVGGHPALDLCNTYAGWLDPPDAPGRGDYLVGYPVLAQWAAEAGLVSPSAAARLRRECEHHPRVAARVLARTLALREALYAVLTAPAESRAQAAGVRAVGDAAHTAVARSRLVPGEGWRPADGLEQPLDACALAAVSLLGEVPVDEVHACPGDGCGWLFHDPSGRRRWCRMEWCGNRLKQRAHAARGRQLEGRLRRSARS